MSCKLIREMIKYDAPKYLKQRIINQIINNGIGTYSTKAEPELIQLKKKAMEEKILNCLEKEKSTIKIIDLIEISKGYKYLGVFDYTKFDIEKLKSNSKSIESNYYQSIETENEELQTLYLDDGDSVYIKFHHKIKILIKDPMPHYIDIRYPFLFVLHKKIRILEVRFDKINTEGYKNHYKFCLDKGLNWLTEKCGLEYKYINLDEIIRQILETDNIATDLIWAGELKNSQGITIKAGTNMETFFDDLRKIIQQQKDKYIQNKDIKDCLDKISGFLDTTLDLANDKFRLIQWNKYLKNGDYYDLKENLEFKVTYNYGGRMLDIINIYDAENNDMERIEYVTKIIGEFRKNFR